MNLDELIGSEGIVPSLKARSKRQVLQELADIASEATGIPAARIYEGLSDREKLGTTGIGHGVAIPHGKFPELERMIGIFARSEQPVDFDSVDDEPVDLFFLLLAPQTAGTEHLKALAAVSRLFRDKTMCEKLRGAAGVDALHALLTRKVAA